LFLIHANAKKTRQAKRKITVAPLLLNVSAIAKHNGSAEQKNLS